MGPMFSLVESRVVPSTSEGFTTSLDEHQNFESDFINTTVAQCKSWAREKQFTVNFIEQDYIAIADTRSATDETLLVSYFESDPHPEDPIEYEGFGRLPREPNAWVDFRVPYQAVYTIQASLMHGAPQFVYPVYFGCAQELTDENGVFDVQRAERMVRGEEETPIPEGT